MAKKIKSSDLFEEEDIFKGIRESAKNTIEVFNKLSLGMKQSAEEMKKSVNSNVLDTTKSIENLMVTSKEATKLQEDSIKIDKAKAEALKQYAIAEQQLEKIEQEKQKTEQQKLRTQEQIKKQEEAELKRSQQKIKAVKEETNAYKIMSAQARDLKNESKSLAAELLNQKNAGQQGTKAFIELQNRYNQVTAEAKTLDSQLKEIDRSVGDNQRSVGDYGKATVGLREQLRKLTMALADMDESDPRFQKMAMEAGDLRDKIEDTQAVVKGLAGSAVENLGSGFAKLGKIGVDAFQGVESAGVLFGMNTDALMETMVKLQALAGLSDALESLGGIGDKLTELKASLTGAAVKLGLFTTAKEVDIAVTETQAIVTGEATLAQEGLNTAMKANPIGLVIAGVIALSAAVAGLIYYFNTESEAEKKSALEAKKLVEQKKYLAKYTKEAAKNVSEESGELVGLVYQLKATNENSKERKDLMKEINDKYGLTLKNLSDENMFQEQLNATVKEYIELQYNRFKLDKNQKYTNDLLAQRFELETNVAKRRKEISDLEDKRAKIVSRNDLNELQRKNQLSAIDAKIERLKKSRSETNYLNEGDSLAVLNEKLAENEKNLEKLGLRRNQLSQVENDITGNGKRYVEQEDKKTVSTKENTKAVEENIKTYEEYFKLIDDTALYEIQRQITAEYKKQMKTAEDTGITSSKVLDELIQKEYDLKLAILERNKEASIETNGVEFAEKEFTLEKMKLDDEFTDKKKKNLSDLTNAEKDYADKFEDNQDKIDDKLKNQQEIVRVTYDYFTKRSNEKIAQLDKEVSAAESQYSVLQELAKNGNINAQQSLAEQQKIINEANLKKERELKRQERMKLAESVWSTYNNKLADEKVKNPLAETIRDTVLLQQFINSLPAFEKGTEDTGINGRGIDGKGGFHAILHPNERVVPKTLNQKIGSMSNEELATMAQEYQNGKIIRDGMQIASALDTALIANKIDELTATIKNKPETNIEIGEITSSIMEVVKSTKVGNTVTYNKFKVKR